MTWFEVSVRHNQAFLLTRSFQVDSHSAAVQQMLAYLRDEFDLGGGTAVKVHYQ